MAGQKLDETAKGVFAIAATPFDDDGGLDLASTGRISYCFDWLVLVGSPAIHISMWESTT